MMRKCLAYCLMVGIFFLLGCDPQEADLSLTPEDVAWASGQKIWKMDLSDAGPVYGVKVVVFENDGKDKRWIVMSGGSSLLEAGQDLVVTVSIYEQDGDISGKLRHGNGSVSFQIDGFFEGMNHDESNGTPTLEGDYYYLMSSAGLIGDYSPDAQSVSNDSNRIAIELVRKPE